MASNRPAPGAKSVPLPTDYIRGGKKLGDEYTAWNTYGQGSPDMGKGLGPGDPYHEVKKKVQAPVSNNIPKWGGGAITKSDPGFNHDPRIAAIRRRLGWL